MCLSTEPTGGVMSELRNQFVFIDEAQSNFRISILKRNRSSLADAWQQRQRKKV